MTYPIDHTPSYPIALDESPERQALIGADVAGLLEHPGWPHLLAAVGVAQKMATSELMAISGTSEPAKYADVTGRLKGVALIEPIARGLVEVGEQAKKQTLRAAKEES
jgi:hypothetical protein